MNLKIKIILLFLSISCFAMAQKESTVVVSEDEQELMHKKRGPNLDHYGHLYFGYGFLFGDDDNDSAQIRNGTSSSFSLGWPFQSGE